MKENSACECKGVKMGHGRNEDKPVTATAREVELPSGPGEGRPGAETTPALGA